ncbi:hypothetical protein [Mycolicibacter arupensis]|uniref:hypothetical protein n=1 Tax=Mycolicibacter arupensis TaxID=342002 RepID=UPI00122D2806|nr:hypothetical protein [Mycolicibacter arupensis]KAA1430451.1 hypothetical protein F0402_14035 [Mycolicibacter arupensis]
MTAPIATVDPASMSAASWSARLANCAMRGLPDDHPDVLECRAALAYWRVRRVADAERDNLDPAHIPALADLLRHPHRAVAS